MIHPILQRKFSEIIEARHALRLRWGSAVLLGVMALALGLTTTVIGTQPWSLLKLVGASFAVYMLGTIGLSLFSSRKKPNVTQLVREIEEHHPELNARLRTAIEQEPKEGGFNYLQQRVIDEAVREAARSMWAEGMTEAGMLRAKRWNTGAVVALLTVICGIMLHLQSELKKKPSLAKKTDAALKPEAAKTEVYDITITPGDAEVERGSKLVVEAKFKRDVPADATLVISDDQGKERERLPMAITVDSKVFGGLLANVKVDGRYHVEYANGKSSPTYKISTFVFPELEHADAKVTPPSYTKQPEREIKNTLKVTLLEGSELGYRFKINKAVKDAELFGEDKSIIPLKHSPEDATVLVAAWQPNESHKYRLHLVDDHERGNKQPPWLTINVLKNQPPRIEVAFPKRDAKISTLQELPLEANLWDDVGVQHAGAVIDIAEQQREVSLPLTGIVPEAKTGKLTVRTLLNMEQEKAEPHQLVSYYFWAEDTDAKGQPRRSMSDMFFAEVREFDASYREKEPPPPSDEPGEKKPGAKLLEQQKQIVNATWKLVRDAHTGRDIKLMRQDIETVVTSQAINDEAVNEALAKTEDAKQKATLLAAQKQMKLAVQTLSPAADAAKTEALGEGIKPAQTALRLLFQLQSNDKSITRADPKSKGKGGQEEKEREMLELELKQKEQRYEEEKQASAEKTKEQQENLAVLSRLKELARREEALAEKMKELEQQLAQAKNEDQKNELANQLKRLQDEQEQLLRDVDDLRERIEKNENQTQMAEAKQQLNSTRDKVEDSLDKLKKEQLGQAQASATRAQKELEQARDDLRQKTAKRFTEEMKLMRDGAHDLAASEQKLANKLEGREDPATKAKDTTNGLKQSIDAMQTARDIADQRARAAELMDKMKTVSEQAEASEPLLHKHLYEALRQAHTLGLDEQLSSASDNVRRGNTDQAMNAEHQAAKAVDELEKGVERAAEGVLGSESEGLRMAKTELDKLIQEAGGNEAQQEPSDKKRQAQTGENKAGQGQPRPGAEGKQPEENSKGEGKELLTNEQGKDVQGQPNPGTEGKQPGQSQRPSEQGKSDGKGMATNGEGKEGQGQPKTSPNGKQPGQGQGQQQANNTPKQAGPTSRAGTSSSGGDDHGVHRFAAGGNANGGSNFFDDETQTDDKSSLTGAGFEPWTDRLRNVEDALNQPALRNEAAKVLDEARAIRLDARRNNTAPQPGHIQTRIIAPLVELRDLVAEELARKEAKDPMLPVDRDAVPERYRMLVQKYYEQLGQGR